MTGLEWKNFRNQDEKKYILKENKDFLLIYDEMINSKFHSVLEINDMQQMMNKIVEFFEFKYPEQLFFDIPLRNDNYEIIAERLGKANKVSKQLDFEQLMYRLTHDMRCFLECSYGEHFKLEKSNPKIWDLSTYYIRTYSNGNINEYDINILKKFIKSDNEITHIEQLYGWFEGNSTDINYSGLHDIIKNHKYETVLRGKILELIPLQMIYSDPINGYARAKSYIRMFNRKCKLDLTLDEVEEILNRDYSQDIPDEKQQNVKRKLISR